MSANLWQLLVGVLIMVSFGTTWFLMGKTAKTLQPWHAQFLFQLLGIPVLLAVASVVPLPAISLWQTAAVVGLGVLTTFSLVLFVRALAVGETSIVSPIADSSVLISIGLSAVVLGELVSPVRWLAVLVVFVGIVLLGVKLHPHQQTQLNLAKGVPEALASAVIWGGGAIGVTALVRQTHWLLPTLGIRIIITLISLGVLLKQGKTWRSIFQVVPWKILVAAALLDTFAFSLYNVALSQRAVAVVLVFSSAQALVTVVLSWWFNHERLTWWQWLGLGAVIGGLIGINTLA